MNPNKLSGRLKFKKASKLNDRASVKKMSRRDLNKSVNLEDVHPNDRILMIFSNLKMILQI